MNQRTKPNAKPSTQSAHPEMQHSRPKTGTPGSEQSKAKGTAKDARNVHDKDGNSQQRAR
ncbi:MAG TPA: hypothetical protein VHM25_10180 [Polyangiaceae bacterium]|nr:hypothetical protein [Polyangiaceae bacterium]